jgi:hypothetical protein
MDYGDPAQVTRAIEEIARWAGCVAVDVDAVSGACMVQCADQQTVVDFWNALADFAAQDPQVAAFALQFRGQGVSDRTFIRRLVHFTQTQIQWKREPGERFQLPRVTIQSGIGDCDCSALLIAAAAKAGGVNARLVALRNDNGDLAHGVSQVEIDGFEDPWVWADGSMRVPLGTHPLSVGSLPA